MTVQRVDPGQGPACAEHRLLTFPYATEMTTEDDWVEDLGAHLMIIVPDHDSFSNLSTDPNNGGPWVMWPDTPYAHIMIPLEDAPK